MARLLWARGWRAGLVFFACTVLPVKTGADEEFAPYPHQLEVDLANLSSFVAGTSLVRVRENKVSGTRLHLAQDLSVDTMQLPSVELTYWFNELNAVQVHLRYFEAAGSHGLPQLANFHG